jgi:hypothetical protein
LEFVLLIVSLSVHDCVHAWAASRLVDQTARLQGRVTLNPMYHVDPFGTLLFPALMIFGPLLSGGTMGGFLFGWAKPTPVITRNFKNIRRDDTLTTLAGPVSNLLLAFAGLVGLALISLTAGYCLRGSHGVEQPCAGHPVLAGDQREPGIVLFQPADAAPARREPDPAPLPALQHAQCLRPNGPSQFCTDDLCGRADRALPDEADSGAGAAGAAELVGAGFRSVDRRAGTIKPAVHDTLNRGSAGNPFMERLRNRHA